MSGVYHHSIPQTVLQEFSIGGRGKGGQVRVYRRGNDFPESIRRASAERGYFSPSDAPSESKLDKEMTAYENGPFNKDWKALVRREAGSVDGPLAARIVNHLIGRTHHFRSVLESGAAALGGLIGELFGSEQFLRDKFDLDEPLPTERLSDLIRRSLSDSSTLAQSGMPEAVIVSLSHFFLREQGGDFLGPATEAATRIGEAFTASAAVVARDAHVKGLKKSLGPEARFDYLVALDWQIQDMPGAGFILPDYVCLGIASDGRRGSLFDVGGEDLAAAFMPLSPQRMLVGRGREGEFDLSEFNAVAAPFCFDKFFSDVASDDLRDLAQQIGTSALAGVEAGIGEAGAEFRSKPDPDHQPTPADVVHPGDFERPTPPVSSDWLAPDDGQRLAGLLNAVVGVAAQRFDLRSLALFEALENYPAVVKQMTGIEVPDYSEDNRLAGSQAYNVLFEDGRTHVLLHPKLVERVLDGDLAVSRSGLSIVMLQLAHLGATNLLTTVFKDRQPVGQAHDQLLFGAALQSWLSYVVGVYRLGPSAEEPSPSLERLPVLLGELPERLNALKASARRMEDVDSLLNAAIYHVATILAVAADAAADLIGRPAGVERFYSDLSRLELARWFELFRSDVTSIWIPGEAYPSAEAFLVLNRHMERLLALGHIFLWDDKGAPQYWLYGWQPEPQS